MVTVTHGNPIIPVWTAENMHYTFFRRRASVLFYTSMLVASVPVYLLVPRLMKAYMYTVIWVLLKRCYSPGY